MKRISANISHLISALLLMLVLCLSADAVAQDLRVVKDNVNCTYGIKNDANHWVVSPSYLLIRETSLGYFLVETTDGMGLLDAQGQPLIQAQYEQLKPFPGGWKFADPLFSIVNAKRRKQDQFLVAQNGKFGIVDREGRVIIPLQYSSITVDKLPHIICYNIVDDMYRSTYADTSGQIILQEMEGKLGRFGSRNVAMIRSRHRTKKDTSDAGVIDRSGQLVIPRDYDQIKFCTKNKIIVLSGDKLGVMDTLGNATLPAKYEIVSSHRSRGDLPCMKPDDIYVIKQDTLYGLMKGDGTVIHSPQFSYCRHQRVPAPSDDFGWLVEKGGMYGTINTAGEIKIPTENDTLIVFPAKATRGNANAPRYNFVFSKGGKFGIMADDGTIVEQAKHDHFFVGKAKTSSFCYLASNLDLIAYDLSMFPAKAMPMTLLTQKDSIVLYHAGDNIVPFEIASDSTNQLSAERYKNWKYNRFDSLFVLTTKKESMLFHVNGKFIAGGIKSVRRHKDGFLEISTQDNDLGIVDCSLGTLCVDTIYNKFNTKFGNDSIVWARFSLKTMEKHPKNSFCENWMLMKYNGTPAALDVFDTPFPVRGNGYASIGEQVGIFDMKTMHWKLPPIFRNVEPFCDSLFAVRTQSNKFGLFYENGTLFADTIYDAIDIIFQGTATVDTIDTKQFWLELHKDGLSLLINEKGEEVVANNRMSSIKLESAFSIPVVAAPDSLQGLTTPQNTCKNCLSIRIPQAQADALQQSLLKKSLYDEAAAIYARNKSCGFSFSQQPACTTTPYECKTKGDPRLYQLLFINEFSFTFTDSYLRNTTGMHTNGINSRRTNYHNFMFIDGELKHITAATIFGNTNTLYDELVKAIEMREDLDLDCNAIADPTQWVGEDFKLSDEGVIFMLHPRDADAIEIVIPWANLMQYQESKKIAALFN